MQFIVTAYDGKDSEAPARRAAVRKDHIELGNKMRADGKVIFGVALLNDSDEMIGSVYIVEFENKAELDQWLEIEPYVKGNVWKDIKIEPCRVGPSFLDMLK